MSKKESFSIISLGCPKNTVDSEILKGRLIRSDFAYRPEPEDAEVVIINTCGFIQPAREESIETILEVIDLKSRRQIQKVFVVGCLSQRYATELRKELPEVDFIAGVESHEEVLRELHGGPSGVCGPEELRSLMTPGHYAYLKIAEGCDNRCAFCSIPLIRGKQRSRSIASLLQEARYLNQLGVQELILISQDLTRYGSDLPGKPTLYALLEELLAAKLFPWVRLLYSNPDFWDPRVNRLFTKYDSLCAYIDIPVQHAAPRILKQMRRAQDGPGIRRILQRIRREIPNVALRTSVMVGYPGESEADFDELLDFIEDIRFERLGVFTYSQEEETEAARSEDDVSEEEKERRREIVIQLQWNISREFAEKQVGKSLQVLIERESEGLYEGRSEWDAPEIDCLVKIQSDRTLKPGEFRKVEILGIDDLDLKGTIRR